MTERLEWCLSKKEGLRIVEPNINLSEAYIKKAEESLESIKVNFIKDWKISTAYYTIYFSLYSLLTRIGVKCEIHSCTIEFVKGFLNEHFSDEELEFFENSLKARIDSLYYTDKNVPDKQYENILKNAPKVLVKCKDILIKLTEKRVREIRIKISLEKNKNKNFL